MLPDLIDKPLALFIAPTLVGHSLRSYGHTLVFAVMLLAVAVVLALLAKRQWPVVLALASSGHLILDTMWYSHRILLWPFTSSTFSPRFIHEWGPEAGLPLHRRGDTWYCRYLLDRTEIDSNSQLWALAAHRTRSVTRF